MKKRKNQQGTEAVPNQNPVAKYAHLFNKAQIFCDKSKYSRKEKHQQQEASPIILRRMIGLASCFIARETSGLISARQTRFLSYQASEGQIN